MPWLTACLLPPSRRHGRGGRGGPRPHQARGARLCRHRPNRHPGQFQPPDGRHGHHWWRASGIPGGLAGPRAPGPAHLRVGGGGRISGRRTAHDRRHGGRGARRLPAAAGRCRWMQRPDAAAGPGDHPRAPGGVFPLVGDAVPVPRDAVPVWSAKPSWNSMACARGRLDTAVNRPPAPVFVAASGGHARQRRGGHGLGGLPPPHRRCPGQ